MKIQRSTIQLLRFHFSFFLLPVFLFALSQVPDFEAWKAILIFVILHLLVYPSSNGYNSYIDRDETPIGGLARPLQPTRQLYSVTIVFDLVAVILSIIISPLFAVGILLYILASRAYSSPLIRLKRFAWPGFITVFVFQGGFIFFIVYVALHVAGSLPPLVPVIVSSLLIGALYPLTQIYQHKEDLADGVKTLSYVLGKRGTFVFSGSMFLLATFFMYVIQSRVEDLLYFYLFLLNMLPVVLFFMYWLVSVWRNEGAANFKMSFRMNLLSTICTTTYFILLFIHNH